MQTWAKRGIQTALVTGGLLMLGTSIASASENVNPDRPASPIDGGGLPALDIDHADGNTTTTTNEAAHALDNTHPTADHTATGGDVVPTPITQVQHVIGAGLADGGVDDAASRATRSGEWPVLSGDLADPPVAGGAPAAALFRVPLDMVGRAVEHGHAAAPATDEAAEPQFGPSDAADSLLRIDQVPVLGDLFTVPNLRTALPGAPLSTLDQTQQFPAIGRLGLPPLSTVAATRQLPKIGGLSDMRPRLARGDVRGTRPRDPPEP